MQAKLKQDSFGHPKIDIGGHYDILLKQIAGSNGDDNAVRNVYLFRLEYDEIGKTDHNFVCGDVSVPVPDAYHHDVPDDDVLMKKTFLACDSAVADMRQELLKARIMLKEFSEKGSTIDIKDLIQKGEICEHLSEDFYLTAKDYVLGYDVLSIEDRDNPHPNIVSVTVTSKDDPMEKLNEAVTDKLSMIDEVQGIIKHHMHDLGIGVKPEIDLSRSPYTDKLLKGLGLDDKENESDKQPEIYT